MQLMRFYNFLRHGLSSSGPSFVTVLLFITLVSDEQGVLLSQRLHRQLVAGGRAWQPARSGFLSPQL